MSAGILDAENILLMDCKYEDKYEKLNHYYNSITTKYPNIKHIFSSIREVKSSTVNTLQCNYYTNKELYSSKVQLIDDIVDRVWWRRCINCRILYSIITNKTPNYICEFANSSIYTKT